jgi:predicted dehydrogenase
MRADEPVRVGVVGTGTITAEHLAFLSASPRTQVVAVADLSPASASYAAGRWGAEASYTSHQELLSGARPEVVHVLTPPTTHPAIVADCLRAGTHVICEKPLAPTAAELATLRTLADARELWLLEDQNYRWNDPVLAMQSLVRDGRLGEVRDVDVRMALRIRDGGAFADPHLRSSAHDLPAGPIHDVLTHLAYLGLLFVPGAAEAERVSAHWSNHGADDGMWRWDDLDATIVDGPRHLRLRFSASTRPEAFSLVVRGDLGEAETDLFQPYLSVRAPRSVGKELTPVVNHVVNGSKLATAGARNLVQKLLQHSAYHGLHRFLEATYAALQEGGPPPLTPHDIEGPTVLIDRLVAPENRR